MKKGDFEARILEKNEYPMWDEFITNSPQGTVFHLIDYLEIYAEASASKFIIFGCFRDETLVGGCSLFLERGRELLNHASTGSFNPYGGFVLHKMNKKNNVRKNEMELKGIIDILCKIIEEEHYSQISITNSPDFLDIRPFLWRGWEGHVAYTYYLNVDNLSSENFSKGIQRNIKNAITSGFYTESIRNPELHYALINQVYQRQNLSGPPLNANFYKKIINFIERKNCGNMCVAKDKSGKVVVSRIWIWDNKRAYAWSAASDPAFRDSGANQLLFFNFLVELKKMGIREIDIMHGNMERLSYHAAGYNPILVPHYVVKKYCLFTNFLRILSQYKK